MGARLPRPFSRLGVFLPEGVEPVDLGLRGTAGGRWGVLVAVAYASPSGDVGVGGGESPPLFPKYLLEV